MSNNINLEQLERIIKLMLDNRLDVLEIDGIKLVKTRYEVFPDYPMAKASERTAEELEDELLFHSAT